ncbi:MAG: FkbM family methyltransferase [Coriobacteriia bacterium]|nr:FkbM family methyltransferase [Coriobacteriia bacterium]
MRPLRVINRVTPPALWDLAKKLSGRKAEDSVPPFVDESVGSFSQFGEDLVIDAILGSPRDGVYVDVGANDPSELSNTQRFYRRGWRGVNIEPNTALCDELKRQRPEDVNLNIGIASKVGTLTFYLMEPATLSTFDPGAVKDNLAHPGARLAEEVSVAVEPLSDVLDEHVGERAIDFLSVDTEGLDLAVLKSNDWVRHRPRLVLVEVAWSGSEIVEYLGAQNYPLVWSNGVNGIFADQGGSR